MTEDDLKNTFQTRVAVESFCVVSMMQQRSTPAGIEAVGHLRQHLDIQEQLSDGSDISAFLASDIAFHRCIMHFVPNADFRELYELHEYRIAEPAKASLKEPNRCCEAWREHAAILDAIESADIGRCYLAVLQHSESTYEHGVRAIRGADQG